MRQDPEVGPAIKQRTGKLRVWLEAVLPKPAFEIFRAEKVQGVWIAKSCWKDYGQAPPAPPDKCSASSPRQKALAQAKGKGKGKGKAAALPVTKLPIQPLGCHDQVLA